MSNKPRPPQSTCPLCREAALQRKGTAAVCSACNCALEFDGNGGKARIVRFPRAYAGLGPILGGRWMTRGEMFAAVDAELEAIDQDDADSADAEGRSGDRLEDFAPASRDALLPITALTSLLVLGCLCMAALAFGATVWSLLPGEPDATAVVSVRTPQTLAEAVQTGGGLTITADGQGVPAGTAPADTPAAPQPTVPLETPLPQAPGPIASPLQPPAAPPTQAPRAEPTLAPQPPTQPAPQPAGPQTTQPPAAAPTVSLPPTFTPVLLVTLTNANVQTATATLLPTVTRTPTPTAQLQPTVGTPVPTLTPTPTYVPGGTIFFGPLRITRVVYVGTAPSQFDEFVEIENIGGAQFPLAGIEVRYIIPGKSPIDAPGPFEFPNGEVILANQKCHLYTNGKPLGEPCAQDWAHANGNLWPDTPGRGITVQLLDADNKEMARFTY
jgi:Lamin Tail Domain